MGKTRVKEGEKKAKEAYMNYISNAEYKQGKSEKQTFIDGFLAGVQYINFLMLRKC